MILILACTFTAVSFLLYSVLNRAKSVTVLRLAAISGAPAIDEAQPAVEDDQPARAEVLKAKLRELLPTGTRERLAQFLVSAGMTASPEAVVAVWAAAVIAIPGLYAYNLLNSAGPVGGRQLLTAACAVAIPLYVPLALIKGRIRRRRQELLRALPDMMDLMTTCVEAGLGIDAAMARVVDKAKASLGEEIRQVLSMMAMGRTRREALEALAARTVLPEIRSFTGSVIQAEQMGVGIGQVLRVQSDALRVQRKQRAEQAAAKAPVKIIMVLAMFIFPAMFIVILGPAGLQIMNGGFK